MARGKIDSDEVCPICKSSRYLNPNMKFMIEPACYHKMCESCVDRIFASGPAPCPVAGCGKTLRKARFKHPNFEDLAVEREVDIRARVERVLNRRESDFVTLFDYNEYLQQKEDLIWNLVKGIDVEATEKKLTAYSKENKAAIAKNKALDEAESAYVKDEEAQRLERSKLARKAVLEDMEEERADRAAGRQKVVESIQHGRVGDAESIAHAEARAVQKQNAMKRAVQEHVRGQLAKTRTGIASLGAETETVSAVDSLGFRGLKKQEAPKVELPYDPFAGLHFETKYYSLQDSYDHSWSERVKKEVMYTAGGYDVREYYARAQLDAHAGLGVFLGKELAQKDDAATA